MATYESNTIQYETIEHKKNVLLTKEELIKILQEEECGNIFANIYITPIFNKTTATMTSFTKMTISISFESKSALVSSDPLKRLNK